MSERISPTQRLANALRYDDFKSEIAYNIVLLVQDAQKHDLHQIAQRAMDTATMKEGGTDMPMEMDLYPKNWPEIASKLKEAANWTCQHCGACRGEQRLNRHGDLADVQIGVAHVDHDPWNDKARLEVLCRRCHIIYDAHDARRKRVMMAIARGQMLLPGIEQLYRPVRTRTEEARPGSAKICAKASAKGGEAQKKSTRSPFNVAWSKSDS